MADNQILPNQTSGNGSMHAQIEERFHWLRSEFIPKHGTKLLVALLVIVAGIVLGVQYQNSAKETQKKLNEDLGKAFNYLYENKTDSAGAALEAFLAKGGISTLQESKAALLLGNLQFQKGDLDAAQASYARAAKAAGSVVVIKSGAEHGLATVSIEKKDFAKAAEQLEAFASSYGKRTGNLEARYSKTESSDEITTVPDALWKLTLCYVELQKLDKAKATADRLVKVYGTSRQATQARKLLATL